MKNLSGGYKGKHFDPTKSNQYNALMTYFQNKGQIATGAPPTSNNGASAAGQATAAQASNNAALTALLPFAFAVTVDDYSDFNYQEEEEALPKSTQYCEGQFMLGQADRIMNRVIRVAEHVSELEELGAAQLSTDTHLPPIEYYSRYEESLTRISNALNGYTEFDAEVTTDIFENDIAQTDNIFNLLLRRHQGQLQAPSASARPLRRRLHRPQRMLRLGQRVRRTTVREGRP